MWLAMVLAAGPSCGDGPVVPLSDADRRLEKQASVLVEAALEAGSSCPVCAPQADCEACDDPLLVLEPGVVAYLSGDRTGLKPGKRYRVLRRRTEKCHRPSLLADC